MSLPEIPEILAFLRSAEPEMLEMMGEAAVLESFRSAAAEVPAYADLLKRHGVDPAEVTDLATFKSRVPLTDKSSTFLAYPIHQLCRGGTLRGIKTVVPSSGHSGTFAFSVDTAEGAALAAKGADVALEYVLEISRRPALVVNCYPMGLQVPTSAAVANTGVNTDVALSIVKAMASYFDQLLIVGMPLLVKKLIEEGREAGVDWKRLRTTLITGGEGFSESWRTYMSGLIGIDDPDNPTGQFVASSMGAGELGLNLFHEIPETIRIVRRAYKDAALRAALFGEGRTYPPYLFVYYPMRSYVEEIPLAGSGEGDLAVSHTALDLPVPLMRYRTFDMARLIPFRKMEEILTRYAPDLAVPGLRLPCAGVFGRRDALEIAGRRVTPEALKEVLFADAELAGAVTGFFRAERSDGALRIDVQLREGRGANPGLGAALAGAVSSIIPGIDVVPRFFEHRAYPHPVSHEKKSHHLLIG